MMICYKNLTVLTTLLLYFELSLSSEWSKCSRSCGTGITYRTVPCHRLIDHCTGTKKEYQVCNTKECPVNSTDFRTKQCQEVGEDLVPFNDMDDPCKLICAMPGKTPVEKGTVVDGTMCGVTGVCVAGTCIPRGCDGLLGSDKRKDKCERCGATEGVCLHVPCNIKEMDGQENVYHVKLPAKSAHIRLHSKSSTCDFQAISENETFYFNHVHTSAVISGNKFELDGSLLMSHGPLHEEILIQIQHCQVDEIGCKYYVPVHKYTPVRFGAANFDEHMWVVGKNYTACSRTCGIGIQTSEIYCINIESQQRVSDTLCKDFTKTELNPDIRNCTMPECPYVWKKDDWKPCSSSCGGGIRKRVISCIQVTKRGSVHADMAECPVEKPRDTETCNNHSCYNHWHKGKYSECSNECGKGKRRRKVICLNAHGKKVNDTNCDLSMKPRKVDECTGDMCTYRWIKSNWTNCSVECANGIRIRTIECHRVANNTPVHENFCIHNISTPKPNAQEPCKDSRCIGEWGTEDWGKCDIPECNKEGKQYRNIHCYHVATRRVLLHNECDPANRPSTEQACNRTTGCPPDWEPVYGNCTPQCYYEWTLVCKQDNQVVSNDLCPAHKPDALKKCDNAHDCENCTADGSCVKDCNMEHQFCKDIPQDTPSKLFQDLLCEKKCCTCRTFI